MFSSGNSSSNWLRDEASQGLEPASTARPENTTLLLAEMFACGVGTSFARWIRVVLGLVVSVELQRNARVLHARLVG